MRVRSHQSLLQHAMRCVLALYWDCVFCGCASGPCLHAHGHRHPFSFSPKPSPTHQTRAQHIEQARDYLDLFAFAYGPGEGPQDQFLALRDKLSFMHHYVGMILHVSRVCTCALFTSLCEGSSGVCRRVGSGCAFASSYFLSIRVGQRWMCAFSSRISIRNLAPVFAYGCVEKNRAHD